MHISPDISVQTQSHNSVYNLQYTISQCYIDRKQSLSTTVAILTVRSQLQIVNTGQSEPVLPGSQAHTRLAWSSVALITTKASAAVPRMTSIHPHQWRSKNFASKLQFLFSPFLILEITQRKITSRQLPLALALFRVPDRHWMELPTTARLHIIHYLS